MVLLFFLLYFHSWCFFSFQIYKNGVVNILLLHLYYKVYMKEWLFSFLYILLYCFFFLLRFQWDNCVWYCVHKSDVPINISDRIFFKPYSICVCSLYADPSIFLAWSTRDNVVSSKHMRFIAAPFKKMSSTTILSVRFWNSGWYASDTQNISSVLCHIIMGCVVLRCVDGIKYSLLLLHY